MMFLRVEVVAGPIPLGWLGVFVDLNQHLKSASAADYGADPPTRTLCGAFPWPHRGIRVESAGS